MPDGTFCQTLGELEHAVHLLYCHAVAIEISSATDSEPQISV